MIERRYENDKKVYVKVAAIFTLKVSSSLLLFGGRMNADIKLIGLPTYAVLLV